MFKVQPPRLCCQSLPVSASLQSVVQKLLIAFVTIRGLYTGLRDGDVLDHDTFWADVWDIFLLMLVIAF